jgi:anti-sigma factor RsiW
MMKCDYAEKVSQMIDGELPAAEVRVLEQHLLECEECRQSKADFLSLRSEIANYERAPVQMRPARLVSILSGSRPARGQSAREWISGALGVRQHPVLATVSAALLIVIGLALLLHWKSQRPTAAPEVIAVKSPRAAPTASLPVNPSPSSGKDNQTEESSPNSGRALRPDVVAKRGDRAC